MPVLAAFLSQSCINDNAPCKTSDYGEESLFINIDLSVPVSTRSSGHDTESGSAAENYIDPADCKIYIFDKNDEYVNLETEIESSMPTDAPNGKYTITAKLNLPNKETKEQLSTFNVMVLANCKTFTRSDIPWNFDGYSLTGDTEKNIYKEGSAFNFNFADLTTGSAWMPTQTEGIPMFGVTTEGVDLQLAIDMGKYGDYPSFSVSMLRALAKIEIVNKTPEEDDITIESCKLMAYNSKGRFIPDITADDNTTWYDSAQIGKASLPSDYTQLDGQTLSFVTLDGGMTYIAYIPEMDLDKIKDEKGAEAIPQVELMVTANGNEYGPYPIDLGEYDGEFTGEYYHALLRNHKYTFNINSVTVGVTGELTLLIDTENWDNDDDKYYYDDLEVKFTETSSGDGTFKWQWERNNVYIKDPAFDSWVHNEQYDNQNIAEWPSNILEQWTGKYLAVQKSDDSGAIATFNITAPERGSWTLALYSDDDTGNHWFYIERWDEETQEWVNDDQRADPENDHNEVYDTLTGYIAGKGKESSEVKIRITARELQYTEAELSARLVMNVTTFDGRMAEVNLMTGKIMDSTQKSDEDYYHIIQIATPKN